MLQNWPGDLDGWTILPLPPAPQRYLGPFFGHGDRLPDKRSMQLGADKKERWYVVPMIAGFRMMIPFLSRIGGRCGRDQITAPFMESFNCWFAMLRRRSPVVAPFQAAQQGMAVGQHNLEAVGPFSRLICARRVIGTEPNLEGLARPRPATGPNPGKNYGAENRRPSVAASIHPLPNNNLPATSTPSRP